MLLLKLRREGPSGSPGINIIRSGKLGGSGAITIQFSFQSSQLSSTTFDRQNFLGVDGNAGNGLKFCSNSRRDSKCYRITGVFPAESNSIGRVIDRLILPLGRRSGTIINQMNLIAIINLAVNIITLLGPIAQTKRFPGLLTNGNAITNNNRTITLRPFIRISIPPS